MKLIVVLLVFASTSSCFCAEAVDFLQDECYWHPNDCNNEIWPSMHNTQVDVTEDGACELGINTEGTIQFSLIANSTTGSCNIFKWHVTPVNGYNIDVTIDYLDLNEAAGDYLIISPGSSLVRDEASVILTGIISTTKLIRVMDHNEMTVLLVIQQRNASGFEEDGGFKLSYKAFGEITIKPPVTTPNTSLPTPPSHVDSDISVYVSGIGAYQFHKQNINLFKDAVAKMATTYCNKNNISTQKNSTTRDNVRLSLITECPRTWPNWETCTQLNMSVPVYVANGDDYQLTRKSLQEMWNMHANDMLMNINLSVYQVPDTEETLYLWLYIFLGVTAIFTLLMVTAWRLHLFNASNKKVATTPYDTFGKVSMASTDSWISNSYQEVPPMTDIPYHYSYDKTPANQDITTSPNMLTVPRDERAKLSDEFGAAFYFQNRVSNIGYDNHSFTPSSEKHEHKDAGIIDDFSSDDESASGAKTSMDIKTTHNHFYEAPKQVEYDNKNESAL